MQDDARLAALRQVLDAAEATLEALEDSVVRVREQVEELRAEVAGSTLRALQAGVFMNEDLFIYYDEADVGFQLQHAHLRSYVDPRVHVRHKNRVKFFNPRSGYLHQRNRVYIVRRYGRWYHRVAFHLGMTLVELPAKT